MEGQEVVTSGRQLTASTVSSTSALVAAIGSSATRIVLQAGTYDLTSTLTISRAVTIEAQVAGSVVLNGMGQRRVFTILSTGVAQLIGLNITGGYASYVGARYLNLAQPFLEASSSAPLERYAHACLFWQGGGLYIEGSATLTNCNISGNRATSYVLLAF